MRNKNFVYVIWSEGFSRKYVGMTCDLENRLVEHNSGKTISTKAFIPWKIIYKEEFETRAEARVREKYFKTAAGRRFLKEKLSLK
jgi:putative endonuclease